MTEVENELMNLKDIASNNIDMPGNRVCRHHQTLTVCLRLNFIVEALALFTQLFSVSPLTAGEIMRRSRYQNATILSLASSK
jgi:uncharacterized protein YceH (UPF0502 family)